MTDEFHLVICSQVQTDSRSCSGTQKTDRRIMGKGLMAAYEPVQTFLDRGVADCDRIETSQEAEYGQEEKQRTE